MDCIGFPSVASSKEAAVQIVSQRQTESSGVTSKAAIPERGGRRRKDKVMFGRGEGGGGRGSEAGRESPQRGGAWKNWKEPLRAVFLLYARKREEHLALIFGTSFLFRRAYVCTFLTI